MMRSNNRPIASGPSGPSRRDRAHVLEDLLLALGLIDFDAQLFLQPADLADAAGAFVQQAHQHFVDAIDVLPQVIECPHDQLTRGVPPPV